MADNITDGIQILSGPASDEFYALLRFVLPKSFLGLYNNNREEIYSRFNGLIGYGQHRMLVFLRSITHVDRLSVRVSLLSHFITVDSIFRILTIFAELEETENYCAPAASRFPPHSRGSQASYELEETENYRAPAASRSLRFSRGSQASYELEETENYRAPAASRFLPFLRGSQASFGPRHLGDGIVKLSMAIKKVETETVATLPSSRRSYLNVSSNINFSRPNFEAGTLHHTQRTLPDQHNSHLTDGVGTHYDLTPVPSHHIPPDYGRVSINMNNPNLNYSTNTQSHFQRLIASPHGIFQATKISPYGDPGASSSSTAAASHGEARATRDDVTAGHSGIFQATEISPYGDPGASSSSTAAASHGEMSNSLQSHYQRPAASHNNPPGHDAVINIPGDGEFTSGHQTIPAEARATRDGETAGHSKFFEILLPVNITYAYKAGGILKSTYHILPPSIKISGCLAVACAFVAAFSSLAGFSLSTFRPSTLPFGWNPQLMLQIIHIWTVFSLGFAFIGIMCHEFLRDDPIILWMVEGLAYAVLTAVLVVIIRRR